MRRIVVLLAVILTITFALSAPNLMAQGKKSTIEGGMHQKGSPFLITGKMPHLTKLLINQWDNPRLNLSAEQKDKLLVIGQETVTGVKTLAKKITPLETQVAEGIFAEKTPDELNSIVQTLAKLKAEATMVHLRCIYKTNKILDPKQLEVLMN